MLLRVVAGLDALPVPVPVPLFVVLAVLDPVVPGLAGTFDGRLQGAGRFVAGRAGALVCGAGALALGGGGLLFLSC
jgi:hypothetical protein